MSTTPCALRAFSKCIVTLSLPCSIVDRLDSFAILLNFTVCDYTIANAVLQQDPSKTVCDDTIAEVVLRQVDPDKTVTRSSFVASVSDVIKKHYQQSVVEDCSLRLLSPDPSITQVDMQSTQRGLERLFDALDVTGSRRLLASVLVAMMGLLSQGTIDDRLHYMITVSNKEIGDVVYVSWLTPVIEGLFLLIDMLMPTAIYALQVAVSST